MNWFIEFNNHPNQSFSQKCESMKHVDSIHENEDTHNFCRICDRSFSHKCGLKHSLKNFMRLEQPYKSTKA